MSTLEDRLRAGLHDLADDPSGASTDRRAARELWSAGRRHHRRQRAGTVTVLVAAVVLLGLTLGGAWVRASPGPAPAGTTGAPVLPDHFYEPSPWLPGTGDDPSGRLVAAIPSQRGTWGGMRPGVVGVSATEGEYHFLDLPDLATNEEATLSPDGRRVAFWTVGTPSDSPREDDEVESSGTITGYAVYDTGSGEVRRQAVPTRHGLSTGFGGVSLLWADSTRLVATYGQRLGGPGDSETAQSSSNDFDSHVWDLSEVSRTDPRPLGMPSAWSLDGTVSPGHLLVSRGLRGPGQRVQYGDVDLDQALEAGARSGARPLFVLAAGTGPSVSPDGTLVAYLPADRSPGALGIGATGTAEPLDDSGDVLPGRVRGVASVLGWTSPDDVVVTVVSERFERVDVVSVDVRTGVRTRVGRSDPRLLFDTLDVATDLLGRPVVEATRPPTPADPRVVAGESAMIVVLAGGALWLWRRRRVHP